MENKLKEELQGFVNDLKLLFAEKPATPQKFAMNGTLPDGTEVMIDGNEPTVGVKVTVKSTDGTESPIADGEYVVKTADSSIQITTVGGAITESEVVGNIEDNGQPDNAGGAGSETPNMEQMANEKIAQLEQRLAEIEAKLTQPNEKMADAESKIQEITVKMAEVTKENTELKEKLTGMVKAFEKFMATPVETPTHKTQPEETPEEKIRRFRREQGIN